MTRKLLALFTCLVPLVIGFPADAARRHGDSPDRDARWSSRAARPVAVSFQLDREAGVEAPKPVDTNAKSPPSSTRSSSSQRPTGGLTSAVFSGRPEGPSGTVGTEILERQDEFGIRTEMLPGPSRDNPWLSTRSRNFVKIPTVASRFVTQASETSIAVFFSAEGG